jgi:UDP-2,4-diacetamido-2,4,6-trideoxy-beta-L-altropyranose hydrolase
MMSPPSPPPRLLIRADAGSGIGAGHVMRCLALAQAWQDEGGQVRFQLASGSEPLLPLLRSEGMAPELASVVPGTPEDAQATVAAARAHQAAWVVLDGYCFGEAFQRALGGVGAHIALVDDNGECAPHLVDLVINQNVHARPDMYPRLRQGQQQLLGTRYTMLRRGFRQRANDTRELRPAGRRVLITLGAADPGNVTATAIQALRELPPAGLEAIVVVGVVNRNLARLQAAVRELPGIAQLQHDVVDMAPLMSWADVAIAGAGSTTWELLFMGVPTISLVLADNQRAIAESLHRMGVVHSLGAADTVTRAALAAALGRLLAAVPARREMATRGRQVIDGDGVLRILAAMREPGQWRSPVEDVP